MLNKKDIYVNILLGVLYSLVFHYAYENYMYKYFSYMYCPNPEPIKDKMVIYIITSIIPLFMYKGFYSIASGISFLIYLIIYIPMLYMSYIAPINFELQMSCVLSLMAVMSISFATDNCYLINRAWSIRGDQKISFKYVELCGLIVFLIVFIAESHDLKYVNVFTDQDVMYELRASYGKSRSSIIEYLMSWTKTAFLPLFLVYYLKAKQYFRYFVIIMCYVIMYMLDMQKVTMIMPFLISFSYWGMHKLNGESIKNLSIYIFFIFIVISFLFVYYSSTVSVVFGLASVFVMRTQCLDAWLFSLYLEFFKNHPHTYYTHINIVNAVTDAYPYSEPLGIVVSNGVMNANASFLITDGYAACGVFGILFIGIIFVLVKCIFNCIGILINRVYLFLILFPAISAMLNVSLFTAILSCGFFLLYLIFRFCDLSILENDENL